MLDDCRDGAVTSESCVAGHAIAGNSQSVTAYDRVVDVFMTAFSAAPINFCHYRFTM